MVKRSNPSKRSYFSFFSVGVAQGDFVWLHTQVLQKGASPREC